MSIEPCHCTKVPRTAAGVAEVVANFAGPELEFFRQAELQFLKSIPAHEAAHAVVAAATGARVTHITIVTHRPCTHWEGGNASLLASILRTCAGYVGDAMAHGTLWRPSWARMMQAVARARGGEPLVGSCDWCAGSQSLVKSLPNASDRDLVDSWREVHEIAAWVLTHDLARGALNSLARALRDQTALDGDDVAEILGGYKLEAAYRDVLANLPAGFMLKDARN
jgi:Peptidase M50B-like